MIVVFIDVLADMLLFMIPITLFCHRNATTSITEIITPLVYLLQFTIAKTQQY